MIVSGGGGIASLPVGKAMNIFLQSGGIPPGAILIDSQSLSTRESALNLGRILPQTPGRKILLTSDHHMFRAARALRKTEVMAVPRPIPDAIKRAGSWNLRWEVFQDLLIETSKIAYY
ncbi:MAG: YdcF family protein [Acidobacteriota bacterium]|nr:YdcF family protein [Acidobacteriota bacterium]